MDDQLIRNEKTYISTSLASDLTDYSRDYIGQLARDGHIESVKVGHKRFVDRDEAVEYALDNKSDLTVDDIPDNHLSDSYTESTGDVSGEVVDATDTKAETGSASDDISDISGSEVEVTAEDATQDPDGSVVLADEKMYADRQPRGHDRVRNQGIIGNQERTHAFDITDRANRRWQKTADGLRPEAETTKLQSRKSKVPAVLAVLFALILSFGFVAGSVTGTGDAVGRIAHNIANTSQKAYYALGVGLNDQLEEYGPVGAVSNSIKETASLAVGLFNGSVVSDSTDSGQVAAAGSTAKNIGSSFASVRQSILGSTSWITQPIKFEQLTFRDYYHDHTKLVQAQKQERTATTTDSKHTGSDFNATTSQERSDRGAVVVPAPESAEDRQEKREAIRSQFSDPVEVTASTSNSGVIQPQFDERQGDKYMYVMVPTNGSSSTSTSDRE